MIYYIIGLNSGGKSYICTGDNYNWCLSSDENDAYRFNSSLEAQRVAGLYLNLGKTVILERETHMKIEVGKKYRLRNGLKARIYALDGRDSGEEVHGAILFKDGWNMANWHENGRKFKDAEDSYDIVSEWKPELKIDFSHIPDWIPWVAMDMDGTWKCGNNEPSIWKHGNPSVGWDWDFGVWIPGETTKDWNPDNIPWQETKTRRPS